MGRLGGPVWPVFVAWVVATVVAIGGSLFVAILAAVVTMAGQGGAADPQRLGESIAALPAVVAGSIAVSSLTLFVVALAATKLERAPIVERLRLRFGVRDVVLIVPGTLVVIGFGQVLDSLAHVLDLMELSALAELGEMVRTTGTGWFLVLLVLGSVGPGLGEELFFRGYAQTRLVSRWGRWAGIVVASLLFGLLHMDLLHAPMAFAIGLALGWLAERAGSIVPGIAVHTINNAISFGMLRFFDPSFMGDDAHLVLGAVGFGLGVIGVAGVLLSTRGRCAPAAG